MAERQTGGLILLGVLLATIVLLPATFGGGSVLGYTDNYTDNVSGSSPVVPPHLQPVPTPQPVPTDLHPTPEPEPEPVPPGNTGGCCQGGGGGVGGGGGGCCGPVSPMSYTPPAAPPPTQSPPPLTPLAIDVARVPIDAVNLIPFDSGGISGGGGGR